MLWFRLTEKSILFGPEYSLSNTIHTKINIRHMYTQNVYTYVNDKDLLEQFSVLIYEK